MPVISRGRYGQGPRKPRHEGRGFYMRSSALTPIGIRGLTAATRCLPRRELFSGSSLGCAGRARAQRKTNVGVVQSWDRARIIALLSSDQLVGGPLPRSVNLVF